MSLLRVRFFRCKTHTKVQGTIYKELEPSKNVCIEDNASNWVPKMYNFASNSSEFELRFEGARRTLRAGGHFTLACRVDHSDAVPTSEN